MNFIYPVDSPWDKPYISQHFGESLQDYSQFGLKGHDGLDFPKAKGSPIYAVHDGWIIEQTAKDTGYGLRICQRIESDGNIYVSVYGHMERLENPTTFPWDFNDKSHFVKAGDVIGYVDSTGFSTGNHLHFGLYPYSANGNKLNPSNGYGGTIDPLPFFTKGEAMVLVNDNGTYYLEGETGYLGINKVEFLQVLQQITGKVEERQPKGTFKGIVETAPASFIIKDK